jgi:hypothetical protein
LRNDQPRAITCEALLDGWHGKRLLLWHPGHGERMLKRLPATVRLGPYAAAVILAFPAANTA